MHWINFPLLVVMIYSGLLIYWADSQYEGLNAHRVYRFGFGGWTLPALPYMVLQHSPPQIPVGESSYSRFTIFGGLFLGLNIASDRIRDYFVMARFGVSTKQ